MNFNKNELIDQLIDDGEFEKMKPKNLGKYYDFYDAMEFVKEKYGFTDADLDYFVGAFTRDGGELLVIHRPIIAEYRHYPDEKIGQKYADILEALINEFTDEENPDKVSLYFD